MNMDKKAEQYWKDHELWRFVKYSYMFNKRSGPGRFCNYDACPAKHCSEIPKCKNPFEKFSLPMFDYAYRLALATYGNVNNAN